MLLVNKAQLTDAALFVLLYFDYTLCKLKDID